MKTITENMLINAENLNNLLNELKVKYGVDAPRKAHIIKLVNQYGYVPYSHIKALKELSPAETIIALEAKLKLNNTYSESCFSFDENAVSPLKRAGYQNPSWMQHEQHNIKLVNLAGLGDGNESKEPGRFIDWLRQLVTLPSGNTEKGIVGTTAYLIPFHPREFGCAYIPKHSGVSEGLRDESVNLSAKDQIRAFIALTQLAGHPVIYDILPQTGRFSKIILANPHAARWFDINELKNIEDEGHRRWASQEMMKEESQQHVLSKVKEILPAVSEEEISDEQHGELIGELIQAGFWPAPGGAWNSAGVPVFDKMSDDGSHPLFKHYDTYGNDVTQFANLDCQTPYYFVYLEKGQYNEPVIEFFINFMKKLQRDYNFDGFRVDHIDHIVDNVSEKDRVPISYRAPRMVLGRLNAEMKAVVPHFASLAEYMLWDNLQEAYHKDMGFDVLWGNDITSQYQKDVTRIIEDNNQIEGYNRWCGIDRKLSILKAYNNQDGEFSAINQYPGQLGEDGALFKWLKLKFIPGGELANRPVLLIDGDESFTKTGIEAVIGAEESMVRADNEEFFAKFDAIDRYARNNELLISGKARIHTIDRERGFVSWIVERHDWHERLLIAAYEKPPIEIVRNWEGQWEERTNYPIDHVDLYVPDGFSIKSELVYNCSSRDFEEKEASGNSVYFSQLKPSEFHIYRLI